MKRLRGRYGCPTELAADILGGKWKTVILARLKEGPAGYGALRRQIPGLSDKVLTEKLRDLERLGLVGRSAQGGTYALSESGERLRPVLELLYRTGLAFAPTLDVRLPPPWDHAR